MALYDVELSAEGIAGLENDIKRIESVLPEAANNAAQRLTEYASKMVALDYRTANQYGNGSFVVEISQEEDGWTITVSGEDVMFLEFGAGTATSPDVFAQESGIPVYPGSWSSTNGTGEFAKYGSWHKDGIKFDGDSGNYILPTHGMEHALEWIVSNAGRILEEEVRKLL